MASSHPENHHLFYHPDPRLHPESSTANHTRGHSANRTVNLPPAQQSRENSSHASSSVHRRPNSPLFHHPHLPVDGWHDSNGSQYQHEFHNPVHGPVDLQPSISYDTHLQQIEPAAASSRHHLPRQGPRRQGYSLPLQQRRQSVIPQIQKQAPEVSQFQLEQHPFLAPGMQSRSDSEHFARSSPLLQDQIMHYEHAPPQQAGGESQGVGGSGPPPEVVSYPSPVHRHNLPMDLQPNDGRYQNIEVLNSGNRGSVDRVALYTQSDITHGHEKFSLHEPLYTSGLLPSFGSPNPRDFTTGEHRLGAPPTPPSLPPVLPDLPQFPNNSSPLPPTPPSIPVSRIQLDANPTPTVRKISQAEGVDPPTQMSFPAPLPILSPAPSKPDKFSRKRIKNHSKPPQNISSRRALQGLGNGKSELPNEQQTLSISANVDEANLPTLVANSTNPGTVNFSRKNPATNVRTKNPGAVNDSGMKSGAATVNKTDSGAAGVGKINTGTTSIGAAQSGTDNASGTKAGAKNVTKINPGAADVSKTKAGATNATKVNSGVADVSKTKVGATNVSRIKPGSTSVFETKSEVVNVNASKSGSGGGKTKAFGAANVNVTKLGAGNVAASEFVSMNAGTTDSGIAKGELPNLGTISAVGRKTKLPNRFRVKPSAGPEEPDIGNRRSFSRWSPGNKSGRAAAPSLNSKSLPGVSQLPEGAPPVSFTANLPPRPPQGTGNSGTERVSPSDTMPKLPPVKDACPLSPRKRGADAKVLKQAQPGPPKRKRNSTSPKEASAPSKPSSASESDTSVKINLDASPGEVDVQKACRRPVSGGGSNGSIWYGVLQKVWPILRNDSPEGEYFSVEKIIAAIESNWTTVRGKNPPKNHRWKGNILRTLQAQAERKPGSQSSDVVQRNTHMSDMYRLLEIEKPPEVPGRSGSLSANDVLSEANGCTGSTFDLKNQSTLVTDASAQATIPREFTLETTKPVQLSEVDKARLVSFVGLPTNNTVKGFKGFRTIRASAGVSEGDWYFEVQVLNGTDEGAVRLGWSLRRSDLETPVGFDGNGFAIRDLSGEFVHRSLRTSYGEPFGKHDTIGCRIQLPSLAEKEKKAVELAEKRFLEYRFVKLLQGPAPPDSQLDIYSRAKVLFYKNGKCFGVPSFFTDKASDGTAKSASNSDSASQKSERNEPLKLNGYQKRVEEAKKREMRAGIYYPAISLYGNGMVRANFGPDFKFGLPEGSNAMRDAVAPAAGIRSGPRRSRADKDGQSKGKSKEEVVDCDDESDSGEEDGIMRDSMDVEEMGNGVAASAPLQDNDICAEVTMHRP